MHPRTLVDLCTRLLERVLRFEQPAEAEVSAFFRENKGLGPRERSTIGDTVYAVLRRKLLFDHLASDGPGAPARRLSILGFAGAREFLAAALSEPEAAWLAACDSVDRADAPPECRHNLPAWLAQALQSRLGDEFWPLVRSIERPAPLDVRVNLLAARQDDVRSALANAGIASQPMPYSPWGLRLEGKPVLTGLQVFRRGLVEVQDEGSQLLALLVGARRGEMVADFCAGAGGKTLALGAAMRNTGRIYAFDTSAHRLHALRPRLERSGLTNVHTVVLAHEHDDRARRLAGKVDRVLVDAPCSGLGTLRRHPDLKWRLDPASVVAHATRQSAILAAAAELIKPGGRLVYATCSLLDAENEAVADAFGSSHPGFRPLDAGMLLTGQGVKHAESLCERASSQAARLRLWPHRHGTDGFFASVWQKVRGV